ncbi:hypothetical protein AB5N19_00247 [Seiridium cardinale]
MASYEHCDSRFPDKPMSMLSIRPKRRALRNNFFPTTPRSILEPSSLPVAPAIVNRLAVRELRISSRQPSGANFEITIKMTSASAPAPTPAPGRVTAFLAPDCGTMAASDYVPTYHAPKMSMVCFDASVTLAFDLLDFMWYGEPPFATPKWPTLIKLALRRECHCVGFDGIEF